MPYPAKLTLEAILDAAWKLLDEGGPAALSMRPLADVLNVRPGSLYRHVDSRPALLQALAERAAQNLQAEIKTATEGHSPREALTRAATSYLHYARTHPHAYAVLLTPEDPSTTTAGLKTSAGKALWNTLLSLVGELSGNPDDTDHAVAYWTFLHGAAALERRGMYGPSGPRDGLNVGLVALLNQMEAARTSWSGKPSS